MNLGDATLAFECQDMKQEREYRAFLDALDDCDYYILRNEGANEGIISHSVIVIHSGSMIDTAKALSPRS